MRRQCLAPSGRVYFIRPYVFIHRLDVCLRVCKCKPTGQFVTFFLSICRSIYTRRLCLLFFKQNPFTSCCPLRRCTRARRGQCASCRRHPCLRRHDGCSHERWSAQESLSCRANEQTIGRPTNRLTDSLIDDDDDDDDDYTQATC